MKKYLKKNLLTYLPTKRMQKKKNLASKKVLFAFSCQYFQNNIDENSEEYLMQTVGVEIM